MAKGRAGYKIVAELRERRNTCAIHSLTFASVESPSNPNLTPEQRASLEKYLQDRFHLWWDSWVAPLIDEVEDRIVKEKK